MYDHLETVHHHIVNVAETIGDYIAELDEDLKDDDMWSGFEALFISFFRCYKQMVLVSESHGQALINDFGESILNLLEEACGLPSHRNPILEEILESIKFMTDKYPNQIREMMENEPGISITIKEAIANEVCMDTINSIISFISQ